MKNLLSSTAQFSLSFKNLNASANAQRTIKKQDALH